MFIDLTESLPESELQFDVCIAGAGAAGIAIARKLERPGLRVALVESGGLEVESGTQGLAAGSNAGLPYMSLERSRLRRFGGTTGHWGGQSIPLDKEDFAPRAWVPHSGWPIAYRDLMKHMNEAAGYCGVPAGGYEWADIQSESGPEFPLPGASFTGIIMRFSDPLRDFGDYFYRDIDRSQTTTCLLHANVTEIVPNEAGDRISHLRVANLGGREYKIKARRFVLACGAIENARLMLASRRQHPDGLGNRNGLVGRFFMEHPSFDTGLISISDMRSARHLVDPWLQRDNHTVRLDFKLQAAVQKSLKILNHSAYFVSPRVRRLNMTEEIGALDRLWRRLRRQANRLFEDDDTEPEERAAETTFKLRIRLEQAPNPDSRVKLASDTDRFGKPLAEVAIRFGEAEGRTVGAIQEELAAQLGKAGLGRMRIDVDGSGDEWQERLGWQNHHCGGTRMHSSPREGVVDENCRVFGIDNLWIAGSSVFPCSGHANPTMNLVALALRLGEHLRGETGT